MSARRKLIEGYFDKVQDKSFDQWLRDHVSEMSDERIAAELLLISDGAIEVTRNTVANYREHYGIERPKAAA